MLELAICDDDIETLEYIRDLVNTYLNNRPELDGSVRCFQSAYDLVDCIKNRGGFDAYLLDILMPYMNGIDLGMAIREIGDQAPIIYLTSSKDYAVDSYRVSTFYYILKPATAEKINEVLDKLFEKLAANPEKPLLVRTSDGIVPVFPSKLLYVHVRSHILYYHMAGGHVVESITTRESFDDVIAPLLEDSRFVKISYNHAINMSYVKALTGPQFLMEDEALLNISRKLSSPAKRAFMEYILDRGRSKMI